MRCFSDVLKKTLPPDVFGDVLEKVKHLTNDASNDVSRPALRWRAAVQVWSVQLFLQHLQQSKASRDEKTQSTPYCITKQTSEQSYVMGFYLK